MNTHDIIKTHGDFLERSYSKQILERIPGYARFWFSFIGNDGSADYLPIPGASEESLSLRVLVWEKVYTLFESLAICWRIQEKAQNLNVITSPQDYLDNLADWISFYANLGRIHDMAEKVATEVKGNNLFRPFDEYYDKRNIVLHYPKVPMKCSESVLLAPVVGDQRHDWKEGMRWAELTHGHFVFLGEQMESVLRGLERVVDTFISEIGKLLVAQKKFKPVIWPAEIQTPPLLLAPATASGRVVHYNHQDEKGSFSGLGGLSGVSGLKPKQDG